MESHDDIYDEEYTMAVGRKVDGIGSEALPKIPSVTSRDQISGPRGRFS